MNKPNEAAMKLVEEMAALKFRDAKDVALMEDLIAKAMKIAGEKKQFKKRVKYGLA